MSRHHIRRANYALSSNTNRAMSTLLIPGSFVQNSLACSCELLYQCKIGDTTIIPVDMQQRAELTGTLTGKFPPSTFSSFSPSLYSSLMSVMKAESFICIYLGFQRNDFGNISYTTGTNAVHLSQACCVLEIRQSWDISADSVRPIRCMSNLFVLTWTCSNSETMVSQVLSTSSLLSICLTLALLCDEQTFR